MEPDPSNDPAKEAPPADPPKGKTLDELLSGLAEDDRGVVLGEVDRARKEAKGLRDRLKAAEPKAAEYDKLAAASQTEAERAATALKEAEQKASQANARIVRAEVKALASENFADPEDAAAFLDLGSYTGADGEVDTAAIKSDLAALLQCKPHLARNDRPGPRPDRTQGSGANGGRTTPSAGEQFADWMKSAAAR